MFDRGEGLDHEFVGDLDDLEALAAEELAEHPTVLDDRNHAIHLDDLATIVYTSGTTGRPKGVVLTHGNIAANIDNITRVVPIGPDDRFLSFLPLSHIAERTVSDFGEVLAGGETWFAESLASVQEDLQACRPTIFFAVPRGVGEVPRGRAGEGRAPRPGPSGCWPSATSTSPPARAASPASGPVLSLSEAAQYKALDALIGRTIRKELGLDKARYLVSGAAPVHPDLLRWFEGLGLPDRRGLRPDRELRRHLDGPAGRPPLRHGRAPPCPGSRSASPTTARSSPAARNVTTGYYRDEAGTAELLDADGLDAHRRPRRASTSTATSPSPAARRTSSSTPRARTSRPRRSRPACATSRSSPRPW